MINTIDHIFGLSHEYTDDQLNITCTIKFSPSHQLDSLHVKMNETISELNKFYKKLYSQYFSFKNKQTSSYIQYTEECKYRNLDLENYEFIRLDYIVNENHHEFVFTVSHIIMDALSLLSMVRALLNSYSVETITSHMNYYQIKKEFINYLHNNSPETSRKFQLSKIFKQNKEKTERALIVNFKENRTNDEAIPNIVKSSFSMNVVEEKAKKHGISKKNYMLLKLVDSIFKFNQVQGNRPVCTISDTRNLRLTPITLVDEALGNYVGRRFMEFNRSKDQSFLDYINQFLGKYNEDSCLNGLIREWVHIQKLGRLPKQLVRLLLKRVLKGQVGEATFTFTYIPMKQDVLIPDDFRKSYGVELIDFDLYLRVIKQTSPYFMVYPNVHGDYTVLLTFNEAYMKKTEACALLKMYSDLVNEN